MFILSSLVPPEVFITTDVLSYDKRLSTWQISNFQCICLPQTIQCRTLHTVYTQNCKRHSHWKGNVVILTKFSSLVALEVVKMTTSGAASDENFVKIFLSQLSPDQSPNDPFAHMYDCTPCTYEYIHPINSLTHMQPQMPPTTGLFKVSRVSRTKIWWPRNLIDIVAWPSSNFETMTYKIKPTSESTLKISVWSHMMSLGHQTS